MTVIFSGAQANAVPPAPRVHAHPQPVPEVRDREYRKLVRLLRQPMRLGILRALLQYGALSFSEIKRHVKITDGNLSMHARKLEEARVVNCSKGFRGRFPRTEYRLTTTGRATLERFMVELEGAWPLVTP